MKLWEYPTRSLQSLQRCKAIISIMTIQQAIKVHNSSIDSTCNTIVLIVLGGNNPKTHLQITQEGNEGQF